PGDARRPRRRAPPGDARRPHRRAPPRDARRPQSSTTIGEQAAPGSSPLSAPCPSGHHARAVNAQSTASGR
ncbi:hypothetical protein KKF91_00645, partial [Myxococcota bacterium]|nr:hypothetical protein [Myxococcota bacterium]